MQNFDHKEIARDLTGKTIESIQVAVKSVVIRFTDGTYLDVEIDNSDNSLQTSMSKEEK